jgi:hypothetical protein
MGLEGDGAPPNGGEFGTRRNWPAIAQKLERSLAVRRPSPSLSVSVSLSLSLSLLPFFPELLVLSIDPRQLDALWNRFRFSFRCKWTDLSSLTG